MFLYNCLYKCQDLIVSLLNSLQPAEVVDGELIFLHYFMSFFIFLEEVLDE